MSNNPFQKSSSGLIIPKSIAYNLEIRIMFNTKTGVTELQLHSETLKEFNTLQIAGVMSEHTTALLRGIVSGSVKATPVVMKGENDGDKPQA
jgi:hypothetical protein